MKNVSCVRDRNELITRIVYVTDYTTQRRRVKTPQREYRLPVRHSAHHIHISWSTVSGAQISSKVDVFITTISAPLQPDLSNSGPIRSYNGCLLACARYERCISQMCGSTRSVRHARRFPSAVELTGGEVMESA